MVEDTSDGDRPFILGKIRTCRRQRHHDTNHMVMTALIAWIPGLLVSEMSLVSLRFDQCSFV